MPSLPALVAGFSLALSAGLAQAGCTRVIDVSVSPTSRLIYAEGERVAGVFPELLRESGARVGCEFRFNWVPRARAERLMFDAHVGDVYMPATRNPSRDRGHLFVPLTRQGLAVVSLRGAPAPPAELAKLIGDTRLRGVFVRGYTLGPVYTAAVERLVAAKRADLVTDLDTLARMLRARRADFTLLPDVVSTGTLDGPPELPIPARSDFRLTLLADVPLQAYGLYLSMRNVDAADRQLLVQMIERARADGGVRRAYLRHYPADVVDRLQY